MTRFEDFEEIVGLSLFIIMPFELERFEDLADIVGPSVGKKVG